MIYLHVPFCGSFCTYCGFYSEIVRDGRIFGRYADAVVKEIAERTEEIEATKAVNTLYIGGGTPSVLPLDVLRRIVEALPASDYDEFTMEMNPEDIVEKGRDYLEAVRALGVNRLSMGVQSFDNGLLKWMNRRHDAERAKKAFAMARKAGFDNISIDLIFGINGLSDELWKATLEEAIAMAPEHISAYQLSIDDESALAEMIEDGRYKELSEEDCRVQYEILCKRLSEAGYIHYEVSNFAKTGREAIHNGAYWRRVPYVGLGPSAHSFDGKRRSWNSQTPVGYVRDFEDLSEEDMLVETIMLALRTSEGLSKDFLPESVAQKFLAEGTLVLTPQGKVRIPESRFFVSDDIIRSLISQI